MARMSNYPMWQRRSMRVPKRSRGVSYLLLAAAVVAAGCGGDGTSPQTTLAEAPAETPAPTPTTAAPSPTTTEPVGASGRLVFSSWGGEYSAVWQRVTDEFTAETGIEVVFDDAPGQHLAQLEAQSSAGEVQWDLVEFGAAGVQIHRAIENGLIQPLPDELLEVLAEHFGETAYSEYGVITGVAPGGRVGVGQVSNLITCLREVVERCPTNAVEFWDVEGFPGERAMWRDGSFANTISALLSAGKAPTADDLFPLDYDLAVEQLEQIRPHIAVWFTSGDQQQQLLRDAEVDMLLGWGGRMFALEDEGLDVEMYFAAGSVPPGNELAVPVGAPNAEAAWAFIEWYASRPDMGAIFAEGNIRGTAHLELFDYLDPAAAERIFPDETVFSASRRDIPGETMLEVDDHYYEWLDG